MLAMISILIFKHLNVFEFTNFPFKTKCNNTVIYSVNNYLFLRGKQEKNSWNNYLIKSTLYLLIFLQNLMIFEGSPNCLFHRRIKTGGVLFHRWVRTRGVLNLSPNSPLHRKSEVGPQSTRFSSKVFVYSFSYG